LINSSPASGPPWADKPAGSLSGPRVNSLSLPKQKPSGRAGDLRAEVFRGESSINASCRAAPGRLDNGDADDDNRSDSHGKLAQRSISARLFGRRTQMTINALEG
jgi:hypothetical protein